jgi:hypothetical protein
MDGSIFDTAIPQLAQKVEYSVCNENVNSVLNIIDINEIKFLIKTKAQEGTTAD